MGRNNSKRILQQKEKRRCFKKQDQTPYSLQVINELTITKKLSSQADTVVIYVDGSHLRDDPKKYAYSFVVVENNEVLHMEAGVGRNHLGFKNIAGELLAAKKAAAYAIRLQKKKVVIFYDFCGIRDIANSTKCRMKNYFSEEYRNFMLKCRDSIQVDFFHVKSHSGNYFNELADSLAKQALGLQVEFPKFHVV